MRILIEDQAHCCGYELECMVKLFFQAASVPAEWAEKATPQPQEEYLYAGASVVEQGEGETRYRLTMRLCCADRETGALADSAAERQVSCPPEQSQKTFEFHFGKMAYDLLSAATGVRPPWGILTGVRPVKLVQRCLSQGMTQGETEAFFRDRYVSPEKIALALETARRQKPILERVTPKSYSLYISIPFCPSRCSYCSFVSHSIEKAAKLVEPYVQLLCRELEETARLAEGLGLTLSSIYMGGGTPTTLSAGQMKRVTDVISRCFPVEETVEYTIEAGRPDTIDREKLEVMREAGVNRVSINPQTLNDRVLEAVGRKHTAAEVLEAIDLARRVGFDSINCDLIAGLPGDTPESFRDTLDRLIQVGPENITVHTLSVKRAARLRQEGEYLEVVHNPAAPMVEYAQQALGRAGYGPYYLYRQRDTLGNLENTGFCRPGKESFYNTVIMEEVQTILAAGAGGTTKLKDPFSIYIERAFNFKYPYEYIERFSEILERKEQVKRFYERVFNTQLFSDAGLPGQ